MLDATESASADEPSAAGARTGGFAGPGSRSARKKHGLLRRTGIVFPALGAAALLVAVVTVASYLTNSNGAGATSMFGAIDSLGHARSVVQLEQERQTIIEMNAAANTLTVDAKPATANPTALAAQASAAASAASSSASSTGTGVTAAPPPADPTAAEAIGKSLLPAYGFNQTTQWTCLYNLWMRESGWNVYAENVASGAYGIPQALPADKMASIGPDWQTDPTTQIKWGLGYIQSVYGTPCGAWQNEVDYGYY